jgi:toxin CcdB
MAGRHDIVLLGQQRVVVLQYSGVDTGKTTLVAPLYPVTAAIEYEVVTPRIEVDGTDYLVATHLLAAVRSNTLGRRIGTASGYADEISRALARLFFGN